MIRLTKSIRFNYRLAGEDFLRVDTIAAGHQWRRGDRDAGDAVTVNVGIGADRSKFVRVPLAADEFEEQKVLWT